MSRNGRECDSCHEIVDVLIPIRLLCEAGDREEMQLRYYCPNCFRDITEEWDYANKGEQ